MLDIIQDNKATIEKAEALGITPLIIGKDVTLVDNKEDVKQANTTILLATNTARELIESDVDGVISIENEERNDHLHYRRAGLDQVSAKILAEDQKALVLNYHDIKNSTNPHIIIGRQTQNARVARKIGTPIIITSMAATPEELPTPNDLNAFYKSIGIPEEIVVRHHSTMESWIARARAREAESYIAEGVTKTQ